MNQAYVISDIHGHYNKFLTMLEKIHFDNTDILYIIGDLIDRGPHSIKLVKFIMSKENIFLIRGNHESMMVESINKSKEFANGTKDSKDLNETIAVYYDWLKHGGSKTLEEFNQENDESKELIIRYLEQLPNYKLINVGQQCFLLIHAGIFIPEDKKIPTDISLDVILNANVLHSYHLYIREHFLDVKEYIEDTMIVFGHTPTHYIPEYKILTPINKTGVKRCNDNKIYKEKHKIGIDCGINISKKLGCLRLDDFKEFYVR